MIARRAALWLPAALACAAWLCAAPARAKKPAGVPAIYRALLVKSTRRYRFARVKLGLRDGKVKVRIRRLARCTTSGACRVGKAWVARLRCKLTKPIDVTDSEGKPVKTTYAGVGDLTFIANAKGLWIVDGDCQRAKCVAARLAEAPALPAKPKAMVKDLLRSENKYLSVARARVRVGKRRLHAWCYKLSERAGVDGGSENVYCVSASRGLLRQALDESDGSKADKYGLVRSEIRLLR